MKLCIYASEVAKLANMHTYESQESAIQKNCESGALRCFSLNWDTALAGSAIHLRATHAGTEHVVKQ